MSRRILRSTVAFVLWVAVAIRKSVGAYNVAMGPDTPYYAAMGDIMNFAPSDTQDLQPHVEYQWKFFGAFIGPNATGDRFDFTASCPDASDCAAYTDGRPCWDPGDAASIDTPSINRYAQWLHLFNQTSGVGWMLHQVPLGNSQHLNIPFNGTPRSGYKDNRAEYLFQFESPASPAIRDQHLTAFANAGVLGVLFGSSDDGDTPSTDLWIDNQPFLKTHVAAVNNNGGFAIGRSNTGVCGTSAGAGGSAGVTGTTDAGFGGQSGSDAAGTTGNAGANGGGAPGATSGGCSCRAGGDRTQNPTTAALLVLSLICSLRRRTHR